jgi:uncharacterized damage-inducible protein DinB
VADSLLPLDADFDPSRQAVVATLAAGLDDQLRLFEAAIAGLSVEALEWQSAPGMNSIGMLAAHLALVEVWWIRFAVLGPNSYHEFDAGFREALGIGPDDDGISEKGSAFPDALRGRTASDYVALMRRARAVVREALRSWTDADLATVVARPQGAKSRRWILYHVLEHFAGHFGQVLLIRHQLRDAGRVPA